MTLAAALPPWARSPFVAAKFVKPSAALTINGRGGDDIVEMIGAASIGLPLNTVMNLEATEIAMDYRAVVTIGTMVVTGDFLIEGLGKINGTAVSVAGNVVTYVPTLMGSATVSLVGGGDQTLSGPGQLPHLDISKSGGTVTVLSDMGVRGNLTGSGGTFAPSAAFLVLEEFDSTVNFSGPVALHNVKIDKVYTEEVKLQSALNVVGDLLILMGGLDIGANSVTVGGNMHVASDSWLDFAIDLSALPVAPLLDVAGTLNFDFHSHINVDTSGVSAGGNYKLVEAGEILGFGGVWLDYEAGVDAIFEDLDSLYLDLIEP